MSNYIHLLTRLHDTPLMMEASKVRIITEAITIPLLMGQPIQKLEEFGRKPEKRTNSKLAVLSVFNSLVSKSTNAASGAVSYQSLERNIESVIDAGATDIGFYIDSPGGEVEVLGLTEYIRNLPAKGINTFSFCDKACSAAYAIAAATQQIYATPIALMGSIGIIAIHVDLSKQAEQKGEKYTVLRSKSEKALGDPFTEVDDKLITQITEDMMLVDKELNLNINKSRPSLSIEGIIQLKGRAVMGNEALKTKLVDKILPNLRAAVNYYTQDFKPKIRSSKIMSDVKNYTVTTAAATSEDVSSMSGIVIVPDPKADKEVLTDVKKAEIILEENQRIRSIMEVAQTLDIDFKTTEKYLDPKYPVGIVTELLTDIAAARDTGKGLDTTSQTQVTDEGENSKGKISYLAESYKIATNRGK